MKRRDDNASAPRTTTLGILSVHSERSPIAATIRPKAPTKALNDVMDGTEP